MSAISAAPSAIQAVTSTAMATPRQTSTSTAMATQRSVSDRGPDVPSVRQTKDDRKTTEMKKDTGPVTAAKPSPILSVTYPPGRVDTYM